MSSCTKNYMEPNPITTKGEFVLKLDNRAPLSSVSAEELVADMRIMAFSKGGSSLYSHEVPVLSRTGSTIRSNMRTGDWELVLISAKGTTPTLPTVGQSMTAQKMYEYTPSRDDNGYLNDNGATELFTRRIDDLETIIVDGDHTKSTAISRNVAMIKIYFDKTPGIDLLAEHTVELSNVPSTISWAGTLLPDKNNPTIVATPLKRKLTFTADATDPTLSASNEVLFIIPAHRGSDFWNSDGLSINMNSRDTTTKKLTVSVNLKLSSGAEFVATKDIPIVARCNGILNTTLRIDKTDVEIETNVKPWGTESVNGDLETPYLNVERLDAEVFGNFPTVLHFWTNQPLNSIYVTHDAVDVTNDHIAVSDINTVFSELAGVGATNIHCTESAGGGYEGYITLLSFDKDPVDLKKHKIYLKAGIIKRELNITTHGIKFISDDAPMAVDKSGISKDGKSLFTFTFTNPGNANFKLGLFSGTTLITQSDYDNALTNRLDFTNAAVSNIDILPRNLDVKFFAGGHWYPVITIQQRPVLAIRILTVGSTGINYQGVSNFGTMVTNGGNIPAANWASGLGVLLRNQIGIGKPIDDNMPLQIYYINKGSSDLEPSKNYDNDFVLNALKSNNIDILFCIADGQYTKEHGPTVEQAKKIIDEWLSQNKFRGIIYGADSPKVNPNWTRAIFNTTETHSTISTAGVYDKIPSSDFYYDNAVYKSIMRGSYSTYQTYPDASGSILQGSSISVGEFSANAVDLRDETQSFYAQQTYGVIDKQLSNDNEFIPLLYKDGQVSMAVHPTRHIVFLGESQFFEISTIQPTSGFLNSDGSLAPIAGKGQHPKLVMNMWEWFLNNVALGKQY